MKNFKLKSILFSLATIVMVTVFLSSCEDDRVETEKPEGVVEENIDNSLMQTQGAFKKEIVLKDETGKNEVTLSISCDDKEILALHNEGSLIIKPIFETDKSENSSYETPETDVELSDFADVHIELMSKKLEKDAVGFDLLIQIPDTEISARGWYSGGPYNFYSWVAPHSFYVKPKNNSNCVSAWFYYTPNQASSWKYCWGGCSGYYLCNYRHSKYWNNNSYDTRLKAQGNNFYVSWY